MPDDKGRIQEGVKRRVELAARLYRAGVAPVIIPSGWYMPKNNWLRQFCEAYIMEQYLHETYGDDIKTQPEPYSTSLPENFLFTSVMFPNLRDLTIVIGRRFRPRAKFIADMTFGSRVRVDIKTCNDDLGTVANESDFSAI
jgi:hypothetical protein